MKNTVKKIGLTILLAVVFALIYTVSAFASDGSGGDEAAWGESEDALTSSGTLEEAISAAESDSNISYIKLIGDISADDTYNIFGSKLTIDLNGKSITGSTCIFLIYNVGTEVTFVDSAGGGRLETSSSNYCIGIGYGAYAVFEGGTYIAEDSTIVVFEDSRALIKGGEYMLSTDGNGFRPVSNSGELTIEGGRFYAGIWHSVSASGTLIIRGGEFEPSLFGHIGYFGGSVDLTEYSAIEDLEVCNFSDTEIKLSECVKIPEGYRFLDDTPMFVDAVGADAENYTVVKENLYTIWIDGKADFYVTDGTVVDRETVIDIIGNVYAKYSYEDGYIEEILDPELLTVEILHDENKATVSFKNKEFYVCWSIGNTIVIEDSANGSIEVDSRLAAVGETVKLHVHADAGFSLDTLTVTDKNGDPVELTDGSFIMPATDVTVTATFMEREEAMWGISEDALTEEGSFASAIAAANSGEAGYIKLKSDIVNDLGNYITDATVTIDLNGKSIYNTSSSFIVIRGDSDVSFKDSVGGGVVESENFNPLIRVTDNSSLSVYGGSYFSLGHIITTEYNGWLTSAEVTVYGGEFVSTSSNVFSCFGSSFSLLGGSLSSLYYSIYLSSGDLYIAIPNVELYIDTEYPITEIKPSIEEGLVFVDENGFLAEELAAGESYMVTTVLNVEFDPNGGEGEKAAEEAFHGIYYLPDAYEFTAPEGKSFVGWSTSPDGELIENYYIELTDSIKLYAVWEILSPVYIGEIGLSDGEYLACGSDEKTTVKPDKKGYAYYKDGKLTLSDFEYRGDGKTFFFEDLSAAITVTRDTEVILIGDNVIDNESLVAIFGKDASISISGNGTLSLRAHEGILISKGDLTLESVSVTARTEEDAIDLDKGDVNISGSTLDLVSYGCCGIYVGDEGNIEIKDTELEIEFQGFGIHTANGNITLCADVSLLGGDHPILAAGNVRIEGGIVRVSGLLFGIGSIIYADDEGNITGGEIIIKDASVDIKVALEAIFADKSVYIGGTDVWVRASTLEGGPIITYAYASSVPEELIDLDGVKVIDHENCTVFVTEGTEESYAEIVDGDGIPLTSLIISDTDMSFGTDYVMNSTHHWFVCTHKDCTLRANDISHAVFEDSGYEEHSADGACVCGYDVTADYDVYVGGIGLSDGDYLTNSGIIMDEKPADEGYAFYRDGVLYLSSYEYLDDGYTYISDGEYVESAIIYSETDLVIEFVGENILSNTLSGGNGIVVFDADLELIGTYSASLRVESYADGILLKRGDLTLVDGKVAVYIKDSSDGIDVTNGDVTVKGGELDIISGDHGIEIDNTVDGDPELEAFTEKGNLYIYGGKIKVNAADDGFDVELDVVIKGGVIDIKAEDNGIDGGENVIISGGKIEIVAEDLDGIESGEDVLIYGGSLYIDAEELGIYSYSDVYIYGGEIEISSYYEHLIFYAGELLLGCPVAPLEFETYEDEYGFYICNDELSIKKGDGEHVDEDTDCVCDRCGAPIKKTVTVGGVTSSDAIYSGDEIIGFEGEISADSEYDGELEIVYVGRGDTVYPETDKAPTEVGEYTVIIRVPLGEIYYTGGVSLDFEINPKYTVSFDANGGVGSMEADLAYGEYIPRENSFGAPACKIFNGWSTSRDGEIIVGAIEISADTVLYAIWGDAHLDFDSNHLCDGCGKKLSEHSFEDRVCTVCGAEEKSGVKAAVLIAVFAVSVAVIGGVTAALIIFKKKKSV